MNTSRIFLPVPVTIPDEVIGWGTLSDEQWGRVSALFPGEGERPRRILEAVLWTLRHNGLWSDLPAGHPHPDEILERLNEWCDHEDAREMLCFLANDWPGSRLRPMMRMVELTRGGELPSAVASHSLNHIELSVRHLSSDLYAILAPVVERDAGDN